MQAIAKARQLRSSAKPNPLVAKMREDLGSFAPNKFMNAIQQNTISVTSLRSGVGDPPKANVIPSLAEATLDCRLLPGENAEEFVSEMKARINDPHITVEQISRKPDDAAPSSSETPLYAALRSAIEKENPGAIVAPIIVPYGTDGQKFRLRGVPTYGIMPMTIDTATLATMHSDSEHIPLDQFRKGLRVYFNLLSSDF
jgi:acetylornithine deacetylase/succinyl-diaminopimelate desuccinylase-like protein